jgi:serine/threonine protein kinase/tetratricopeptide (TPR) repeat protein
MIGQTIAHYRIIEKLGQGGMGVVYKAEDTKLGRTVALKFPPPQSTQSAEEFQRLIHEARAAASLDHQNICTIHEIGEADGQPYIAMSYVEGMTLRDRLAGGSLDVVEVVKIAAQVADGLSVAHEKGITHRDIKPENIMINTRGQVKIMDFGLAKSSRQTTKITQEGSTPGTAAYMSPEQAKGEGVDARSDLWSLGVVLYESLTGKLPFEGSHPAAMMYAVLHEPHRTMGSRRSNLPVELTSLIDRLLRKDPVQRPVGTKAVAAELAQIREMLTGKVSSRPGVRDSAQPSLAVLPFTNMSTDPENEFFADGLTEDLITAFSKLDQLRVVARTSAFQFKGKTSDVRLVGEQLNVGTILEGSVRKSGSRLRVTAQLINVADGFHIWSERYDREMADVFEVQDDIVRAIIDALKVKLIAPTDAPLVQGGTGNMDAYHLVLQGRHHWNRRTVDSLAKAEACFREAVALDPQYAEAHGALALTYAVMQDHTDLPHSELGAKIERAAESALRLNSDMPEAHAALGMYMMDRLDWAGAERALRRAIDANPGYATAHHWYSLILGYQGRLEEARREIELAQSLDPLSLIVVTSVAWPDFYQRNYERALKQLDRVRKLDPNFPVLHLADGFICYAMGRFDEAAKSFQRLQAINPRPWSWLLLARCEYMSGHMDQMIDALERWCETSATPIASSEFRSAFTKGGREGLTSRIGELLGIPCPETHSSAAGMATLFMSMGDHDRAFAWLEAGIDPPTPMMRGLAVDPLWDPLRGDPRFPQLLKKLGLPVL